MTIKSLTRAAAGVFVAGAVMMAGDGGISYAGASPTDTFNSTCRITAPGGELKGPIFNTNRGAMMFETCANGGSDYTGRVFGNNGGQAFLYKNFNMDDTRDATRFQRELDNAVREDARNQQRALQQAQRGGAGHSSDPLRDATRQMQDVGRGASSLGNTVRQIDRALDSINNIFK